MTNKWIFISIVFFIISVCMVFVCFLHKRYIHAHEQIRGRNYQHAVPSHSTTTTTKTSTSNQIRDKTATPNTHTFTVTRTISNSPELQDPQPLSNHINTYNNNYNHYNTTNYNDNNNVDTTNNILDPNYYQQNGLVPIKDFDNATILLKFNNGNIKLKPGQKIRRTKYIRNIRKKYHNSEFTKSNSSEKTHRETIIQDNKNVIIPIDEK